MIADRVGHGPWQGDEKFAPGGEGDDIIGGVQVGKRQGLHMHTAAVSRKELHNTAKASVEGDSVCLSDVDGV